MTTVQTLASEMTSAFETRTRSNGDTFYALRSGSPEWMRAACRAAHGDMFPDDWRYAFTHDAVTAIAENDDLDDAQNSIEVDMYTNELTAWLASSVSRVAYLTAALEEWTPRDGFTALQLAQRLERREVYDAVLSALIDLADDAEEAE